MDSYPCACGGENPTCFRCDGTGMLEKSSPAIGRPHRNFAQAASESTARQVQSVGTISTIRTDRDNGKYPRYSLGVRKGHFKPSIPSDIKTSKLLKLELKKRFNPAFYSCVLCGARVKDLQQHQDAVHSPTVTARVAPKECVPIHGKLNKPQKTGIISNPSKCPVCRCHMATHALLCFHIRSVHGKKLLSERIQYGVASGVLGQLLGRESADETHTISLNNIAAKVRFAGASGLTKCTDCGANVKNLRKHQRKAHTAKASIKIADRARSRSTRSTPAKIPSKTPIRKDQPKQQAFGETSRVDIDCRSLAVLDAKHHWGQSFRDHGNFGSYPSHDDMDDESSP